MANFSGIGRCDEAGLLRQFWMMDVRRTNVISVFGVLHTGCWGLRDGVTASDSQYLRRGMYAAARVLSVLKVLASVI
jgi:hypothetical protein